MSETAEMLDLHCHILPGVDDGAVDLADTVAMARAAVAQGCRAVVATSHLWENLFDTSPELLREEYPRAVRAIEKAEVPLEVFPGAENFLAAEISPQEFAEKAVPLGEAGRYVLFDFSLRIAPGHISATIEALKQRGRVAVIAHPERNLDLQADPSPIADWIAAGAIIQVNSPSLLGILGKEARAEAIHLLESGAVHVLASDAHNLRRRPFTLRDGRKAAAEIVGEEEADRMTRENPWKIVRGEDVETKNVPVTPRSGAKRFFRKILPK